MLSSSQKRVQLAICSIKSGLPFLICKQNTCIIVFSLSAFLDFCPGEIVLKDYFSGFADPCLVLSAEKLEFFLGKKFLNGGICKISSLQGLDCVDKDYCALQRWSEARSVHACAIKIAKKAEVFPDLVVFKKVFDSDKSLKDFAAKSGVCCITEDDFQNFLDLQKVKRISSASVKLKSGLDARFICYQSGLVQHCAILLGADQDCQLQDPLVRVHSSCYTGDLFGSLACDCQDQLNSAIELIKDSKKGGIIIYLMQEGRGIGLANKLMAYDLQSKGLDTAEANLRLGFSIDERDFKDVKLILDDLGVKSFKLITNSSKKLLLLKSYGLQITHRVPMKVFENAHNKKYLKTKFEKMGHIL